MLRVLGPVVVGPIAAVLSLVTAGCGSAQTSTSQAFDPVHGPANAALQRASREIPCPESDLRIDELGAGGYRVSGCGTQITYTCVGKVCAPSERVALVEAAPAPRSRPSPAARVEALPPASGTWTDDQVHQLLVIIHDRVVACLPEDVERLRLRVSISASGMVRRVAGASQGDRVSSEVGGCIDQVLQEGRMTTTVTSPRQATLEFRRGWSPAPSAEAQPPAAPPPGAEGGAGLPASLEATVRAAVDARAPAILACVEDVALSMQVSWTREGHLDVLLRGDRQGSPEEQCVRAIVQQITIAAPGSTGTIVHAVQR